MISENHDPPPDQITKALGAMESWAVRRTLLRRTMKDVNKFVVSILQELDHHPLQAVGDVVVGFLHEQETESRVWPSDGEVYDELPRIKLYGNIKQALLRTILTAIERRLRGDPRTEQASLPSKLDIEHVMPRGWRSYWGEGVAHDPEASARRDAIVNTIGNLTLVTQRLNVALSHRPWTDDEAAVVAPTGKDAGIGKRSLLNKHSILMLNKKIVDSHPTAWTESDIAARSAELAELVTEVWPR